jgi:signal transduction histidine kinase
LFDVQGATSRGKWSEPGARLRIQILPAWYQAFWFRAGSVTVFLIFLWRIHRLRVGRLEREFGTRLEERVSERTRIARELHDTLLQSFQASLVQMQAARTSLFRRPEQAVGTLDQAISMTEGAIAEGRDAIQGLRSQPVRSDFAKLLTATGKELADSQHKNGRPVTFRVAVEGEQHPLEPLIQDEAYRITRELLRNAFQHANANNIEAEIRYENRVFRLRVRDDGKGIEPKILRAGGPAGHWGLLGMRERAKRIGGQLEIWSQEGAGTEVELRIPGSIAYVAAENGRQFRLFTRKKGNS